MHNGSGPAWLGIGAQRSGTTWLTDLLVQHPDLGLGTNGKKEQHALQRVARGSMRLHEYLELFPDDGLHRGDFTPRYLNNAAVPALAARMLSPDAPVIVVLRDPVERLASALRRRTTLRGNQWPYEAALAYAQWAGMYLPQLDLWASHVGRQRMIVLTYEQIRDDPAKACAQIWQRLGVRPVPLHNTTERSSSSATDAPWEWPAGLRESLIELYAWQLDGLARRWGVRTELWSSFAPAAVA